MARTKKTTPEKIEDTATALAGDIVEAAEEALTTVAEAAKELSKEEKLAALKEKLKAKAKALEGKVSEAKTIDIKEEVKGDKEDKKDTLVPIEDYLKSSIHLGTRVITPDMRSYVYRRRADGLAVFNTALLDDKLREGAAYLSQFAPHQITVICKREAGWNAVKTFAETLGIRVFTKKYPAGVLTNTKLDTFFETDLILICDPWLDKNALTDANKIGVKVMSICDTNNFTTGINCIVPGNNKSWKSLGMIFYLLTKLYIEKRGMTTEVPPIQQFVEGWDSLQPPA